MYHHVCMDCGYEWNDSNEEDLYFYCPKCQSGDFYTEPNEEYASQTENNISNLHENNKIV